MLENMVPALHQQGVECAVITTQGHRVGIDSVAIPNARVRAVNTSRLARLWTAYSSEVADPLKEEVQSCDVIHIHELWHYPGFSAHRAALNANKPYVITVHGGLDPWALGHKGFKKKLYMALLQRKMLDRAATLHALTAKEALDIRGNNLTAPVIVIPNGINIQSRDPSKISTADKTEFKRKPDELTIMFMGRLHPIKGLDILSEAFGQLSKSRANVRLVIAGPDEGGYQAEIETLLRKVGALHNTLFTGWIDGDTKATALESADVFVLPSYSEGFSMSVLEAMAYGLPVIISKQCDFPEVEEAEAGVIINTDADSLTDSLNRLLDNPQRRKEMGARGRKLVQERYNWDNIATQLIRMYEHALA